MFRGKVGDIIMHLESEWEVIYVPVKCEEFTHWFDHSGQGRSIKKGHSFLPPNISTNN